MSKQVTDKLLWLDLETTDLDPKTSQILEVGMVVTDSTLRTLGTFSQVVHHEPLKLYNPVVIREQLPALEELLHYRMVDVQSFREAYRICRPEAAPGADKLAAHRTIPDICNAIERLRFFLWGVHEETRSSFRHPLDQG